MSSISKFQLYYVSYNSNFTVAVFVMVIYNAFSLSANARLTQLGILSSVGASPKQIKRSVVFEGFTDNYTITNRFVLGWLLCNRLIVYINSVNYHTDVPEVVFTYGIPAFCQQFYLHSNSLDFCTYTSTKKYQRYLLYSPSLLGNRPQAHQFPSCGLSPR